MKAGLLVLLTLAVARCDAGPEENREGGVSTTSAHLTSSTVVTSSFPNDKVQRTIVQLTGLSLTGGVPRYLDGQYEATVNVSFNVFQGAQITCEGLDPSMFTTINNQGNDVGASKALVRALFVPPSTGTYTCKLLGHAYNDPDKPATMSVVPGPGTWLRLFDTPAMGAAQWRDAGDIRVDVGSPTYVLRKTWTASLNATTISANGDVELTNLTSKSEEPACLMDTARVSATVKTTLYATQLNSAGVGCRPATTAVKTTTINPDVHHLKVFNSLRDVPICRTASCASAGQTCTNSFAIKVLVSPQSGSNAVCVHGSRYSNGIAFNYKP